ncbi:MAG: iron ABC transporter permease [Candidimonas sp.]|nr:MAG: iron ABC transporter permease [Candidimonas sp.]TAM19397.1 MAG: iron ABC transporter permease [Candidimonas sp.]TAM79883.1 MAG: iron ABC transporter permease [Candidimonas sp.]
MRALPATVFGSADPAIPARSANPHRTRTRAPRGLLVAATLSAVLVLIPLLFIITQAFNAGTGQIAELLWRPLVGELLFNTVLIAGASTCTCAVLGTVTAWLVERTQLPGWRVWAILLAAPLAVPAFITSYAWISLSQSLQDFAGALLVITSSYYPLVLLPVAAALRGLDPALEETARALGCGPWRCFFRVVLPQLRSALLGGMLLVALGVLAEFGAFSLLRFRTFTTEIYAEYRASFDGAGASLLACVLVVLCLACLAAEWKVRGSARYDRADRGVRRAATRYELGSARWAVVALCSIVVMVTLGVPLGMTGYWLTQHNSAAISLTSATTMDLLSATFASVRFGVAGAALTTALSLPLGFLLVRYPSRVAALLERTAYLSQGMPGIVLALAVVSLAVRVLLPLYQSTLLLVVTYAVLFLPLALVGVRAALVQVQSRLEDAARALGLRWYQVAWRVLLPLAGPGLGAAAALVFISVVTELTTTLLLAPIGTQTLATQVWVDTSTLAFAAAAPYAALLVAISLGGSWLLMSLFGKSAILGA